MRKQSTETKTETHGMLESSDKDREGAVVKIQFQQLIPNCVSPMRKYKLSKKK